MGKKRVLTGIKPTGLPHLGNYLGAIRPTIEMSHNNDYECFYFLANYHSLTVVHDPEELRELTYQIAAAWLALGLNLDNALFYKQSNISELMEIQWILACCTSKGLMNRAHAYKALVDKNRANKNDDDEGINIGVYTYPVLMAADILTFDIDLVPVGADQVQHIEIARDIAGVFNNRYKKDIFKLPQAIIPEKGSTLPGLDGRKMSKSYNNTIPLFLPEKKLRKMVMKIVTDSSDPSEPKDPNNSYLFDIYQAFADPAQSEEMKQKFLKGIGWGEVKQSLFEVINDKVKDSRKKFDELLQDKGEIDRILKASEEKARNIAAEFLTKVKQTVGVF